MNGSRSLLGAVLATFLVTVAACTGGSAEVADGGDALVCDAAVRVLDVNFDTGVTFDNVRSLAAQAEDVTISRFALDLDRFDDEYLAQPSLDRSRILSGE